MLRTGASRLASRSLAMPGARPTGPILEQAASPVRLTAKFTSLTFMRPQLPTKYPLNPVLTAALRRTMANKIDAKAEEKYAHEKLKPTPETVSTISSVHSMFSEVGTKDTEKEVDMMASVKSDLGLVKETFDMASVPREAYLIGLAGVLPYLGTSLSTVLCSWEINHSTDGSGFILSQQTAETLLHVLEPLQIGYGAVILSFLGAIHWGLEFAGYGGRLGYKRYAIGVATPAIAWPTLLMPVEYALISQFAAFTLLYYIDVRATYRGWTPPWYAIYRFSLTFIVGASIVVSLIGRGEVSGQVAREPGAVDKLTAQRESAQEKLAREEEAVQTKEEIEGGNASKDGEAETDDDEDKDKDEAKEDSKDNGEKDSKDEVKDENKKKGKDEKDENKKEGKDEKDENKKEGKDEKK